METVELNLVNNVFHARKLAKKLNILDETIFEIVELLDGKTSEETLELVNESSENYNQELIEEVKVLNEISRKLESDISFHFEVNGKEYRIIKNDYLMEILKEEINDGETLPFFNANFLSRIIEVDANEIRTCQENNCYEIILKVCEPYLDTIAEEYVNADGFGHHFSGYDGVGEEIECWSEINGENIEYMIFRTN